MANYFSSAPLDFGAREIAQGYAGLANSIGSIGDHIAAMNRQKQQQAIEEQMRQSKLQEQLQMEASSYGVQPAVDPKTGKMDPYATAALVKKAKDTDEAIKRQAQMMSDLNTRNDFETANDLAARGLKAPGPITGDTPAITEQQAAAADPRKRIFDYDQQAAAKKYENERRMSAESELAKQRAAGDAKEIDAFRSAFGREPTGPEIDPNSGRLSASALGAIQEARVNSIKGFMSDPAKPGGLIPVPGGPADIKMKSDQEKAAALKASEQAKEQALADSRSNVLSNIDAALPQVGFTTAGVLGGRTTGFNQSAQDLHANLDAIKSGLGVDTLNQMRASSANGSTGIGRIMQVEFDAFSKAARNLDQKQSPEQLRQNLTALKEHLQKWTEAHNAAVGGGDTSVSQVAPIPSAPIQIKSIKRIN